MTHSSAYLERDERIFGLLAEYESPEILAAAAAKVTERGFERTDAYAPFPIEGLPAALGYRKSRLGWLAALGGATGILLGFALQYYTSVVDYPINVGGRPLASWPAFAVISFELCILTAAVVTVFGMFVLNGLPQPYHPCFNVDRFAAASTDGFFLLIESSDPRFARETTRELLSDLGAIEIYEVPH